MGMLNFGATVTAGGEGSSLQGVNDVLLRETPAGTVLYILNAAGTSALTSFGLAADGSLSAIDMQAVGGQSLAGVARSLTELTIGGVDVVLCTGLGYGGVGFYRLEPSGAIGPAFGTSGDRLPSDLHLIEALPDGSGGVLIVGAGEGDTGLSSWRIDAAGVITELSRGISGPSGDGLRALAATGQGILIAGDADDNSIVSYRIDASGVPVEIARLGAADGIGINDPTVLEVVEIDGQSFALLGASGSGSISVFAVDDLGNLMQTDHVMDTLNTRFAGISVMDSLTVNGRVLIAAAGADDGVTLLELLPNGRLVLLDQVIDTPEMTLDNISTLTLLERGGMPTLLVTSETEPGMTALGISGALPGGRFLAGATGGPLTGSAAGDLIFGGSGADLLMGEAGLDVIHDGAGTDTLYGGAGADLFVLAADRSADVIADFEFGSDRLDLSNWPLLRNVTQLEVTMLADGMLLRFGAEELRIISADGRAPHVSVVQAMNIVGLDRFLTEWTEGVVTAEPSIEALTTGGLWIEGTPEADQLSGTNLGDSISGADGSDRIEGWGGYDTLRGDAGDDLILGGAGNDVIDGGPGMDEINGGIGFDTIIGGDGADTVFGMNGYDLIHGGAGADSLHGNNGNDTIHGEDDADSIFGGVGLDRLFGGGGNDLIEGGNGADTLDGGLGDDLLYGNAGADLIFGGDGDDILRGGINYDTLFGGAGNDALYGERGQDQLFGGDGDDLLGGGEGNDTLDGGLGNDTLVGGLLADRFIFTGGHDVIRDFEDDIDTLVFEESFLLDQGIAPEELLSHAQLTANGLLFDFGADHSLLMIGVETSGPLLDDLLIL